MTFEDLVKNHSAEIIEKLVTAVLSESHVDVRFDFLEQDQWAVISMHQYEEDKEISLRLHLNNYFDLVFGYYDDEDEFFEIIHPLTDEEKQSIPEGLKKVMQKVVSDEEGMRVRAELLTRK